MKTRISKLFGVGIVVGLSLFVSNVNVKADATNPTIIFGDSPGKTGGGQSYVLVDTLISGTNTTNTHVVQLGDSDYALAQVSVTSVTVGTITISIQESMDGVTYGSVTACEIVQATNTLQTNSTVGSTTGFALAGDYRGTHTATFGGVYGSGTVGGAGSHTFYQVRPVTGTYLRVLCTHTTSGTDTGTYKVLFRRGR